MTARLLRLLEQDLEAVLACPADGEPGSIVQDREPALFAIRLDARDAQQVGEVGTVDASALTTPGITDLKAEPGARRVS